MTTEPDWKCRCETLIDWFAPLERVVVAFSGGVDSTVVLAASLASGTSTLAATADSPSVARWQLDMAKNVAKELGVDHRIIKTQETELREYQLNDSSRCFHCKSTLYASIHAIADLAGPGVALVSGTNADDLGDFRPGIQAGRDASVLTPLAELGIDKATVRAIAKHFGVSNADLPASPCLASRIAYGVEVTPERLARVESAEQFLRQNGLGDLRVRLHENELARIEVPSSMIASLSQEPLRSELVRFLRVAGFNFVTLDLEGLSSGSLNRPLVSLEVAAVRQTASKPNVSETHSSTESTSLAERNDEG